MLSRRDTGDLRALRVRGAGADYLIEREWVYQVVRGNEVEPLADDTDGLVGTLPSPSGDVPVFHFSRMLGRDEAPPTTGQVVVMGSAGVRWGLLVDDLTQATGLRRADVRPLPDLVRGECGSRFRGVVREAERLTLLVDPAGFCPDTAFGMPLGWDGEAGFDDPTPLHAPDRMLVFATTDAPRGRRPVLFGLRLGQVAEVLESARWTPVPGADASILGLTAARSGVMATVDLAARLGMPAATADARSRLIVVRLEGMEPVGLLTRPNVRVVKLPLPNVLCERELPGRMSLLRGAVETELGTLLLPDLEAALMAGDEGHSLLGRGEGFRRDSTS